ncbi:MAG TPA: phosphoenolpyruvate--protein phosphotransferase [Alphaproteobacteria bacterium]|nr:phosphoenolpyruvate--protein phosphotransferase [Alphaproteobacteria bacterium]
MAGSGSAQSRLDKIVRLIANDMVAEVCSCYVLRAGEVLELFATEGLNPDAVHKTRLRVGEGLVGMIAASARSQAIENAPAHPDFAYRPETGEDPFHSLMGVPILRGGTVRGVLVVQNRQRRRYHDEEVETLETIAMVVAELVAAGELVARDELAAAPNEDLLPSRLTGLSLNGGLAMGLAVVHRPQITIREMVAEDPAEEQRRLREALARMHSQIDTLLAEAAPSGEDRDILETYKMFAEDHGWLAKIGDAIRTGLTAEAAVQRVQNDMRVRMSAISDPYLRERLNDFEDLTNRLLQHLAGKTAAHQGALPDDVVLVARSMGPAELLDYDRRRLRALVLEEGSQSSHVAIVARALDLPVVGRCAEALARIEPLDPVIVDGDHGQVFVRPGDDVQETFQTALAMQRQQRSYFAGLAELPAETRDGVAVALHLNVSMLIDLPHLDSANAAGIGLYRTEIPFMVRSAYPDVAAQTELYRTVLARAGNRPVVFRTLDVGGDKTLPYLPVPHEENPALGWRAIRIGLDRPSMLRQQLRALLRAAAGGELRVMFPMVAEVAEFDRAKALLGMELERLWREGYPAPQRVMLGTMLEVPSLLLQLPQLLPRLDFISVGSNDLMQYLFATDRNNPMMAGRYDHLSPSMLFALRHVVAAAAAAGKPVSVCGEMAGRPVEAMALLGLGLRSLSMPPQAIGPVKAMVRSLDLGNLTDYLDRLLRDGSQHSLRGALLAYAQDHGVDLSPP